MSGEREDAFPFLAYIGTSAREWARTYTALTEALLAEGVEETVAREEARATATMGLWVAFDSGEEVPPWLAR